MLNVERRFQHPSCIIKYQKCCKQQNKYNASWQRLNINVASADKAILLLNLFRITIISQLDLLKLVQLV